MNQEFLQHLIDMASLVAQLVKNTPAMRENWVRSLGWEDPLEMGKATHSNLPACVVHGVTNSRTQLNDFHIMHQPNPETRWGI